MEAKARLQFVRMSPQKARIVADMVRGKRVGEALQALQFTPRKPARILSGVLKSAVANAEQQGVQDVDRLFIKTIQVNQGPALKRFIPRAQGRATPIRKPTSHVDVILAEQ